MEVNRKECQVSKKIFFSVRSGSERLKLSDRMCDIHNLQCVCVRSSLSVCFCVCVCVCPVAFSQELCVCVL